ncbi:MAG: GNAT family N-acetyltransferase [Paracoccus denitrificans]|nr:MAG: GNAT family N-acetyltransferase [Paracoccus denitrificans]PZO83457.1 MAG: GNAT family N-acetyltransferase [Paracoccus denitrificans]
MAGRYVTLRRLSADDAPAIFAAVQGRDEVWDYMTNGPFADADGMRDWLAFGAKSEDPFFYAVTLADQGANAPAVGYLSYLRIDPANAVIEIGHILFSPTLQRTPAASEAVMLLIAWAFDAGYRRVEWKCNALNAPSMRAAERYGFTFEGTFRQHMVIKGRSRDTAWWSITDDEWPALSAAYETWLSPANFDTDGRQIASLSDIRAQISPR